MPAHLESLDTILKIMVALDKEQFTEQYPGYYLVAMGFLSAEEIVAHNSMGKLARNEDQERTLPMTFGEHPKHDPKQRHPLAGLVFHLPPPTGEGEEYLTLGRALQSDLCVPDPSISEEHCRLQPLHEGLVVADVGSTNGTSINLQRLAREQVELLADGDMLTVGRYSFQLLNAPTLYSTLALIRSLGSD